MSCVSGVKSSKRVKKKPDILIKNIARRRSYLVTPSDYDKLTAAYFLPEEYLREDPCRPRFLHPRPSLRPLITNLIS